MNVGTARAAERGMLRMRVRGLVASIGAGLLLGASGLPAADAEPDPPTADAEPVVIPLTRAMIDARTVQGLALSLAGSSADTLRVAITYERNPHDHLARATVEQAGSDSSTLNLPVKIKTDGEGRDGLVFSVSKANAEGLSLKMEMRPREDAETPGEPRTYRLALGPLAAK
jgi:hypothetical protein